MKKPTRIIATILVFSLILIQLIPVPQHNPPVLADISTPPAVKALLRRACYDCHSHETVWPWYSNIAPISWLLAWDVYKGRDELNFSNWDQYSTKKKSKKIKEIVEEVDEGEMPPWFYIPLHPAAHLSSEDLNVLRDWASEEILTQQTFKLQNINIES